MARQLAQWRKILRYLETGKKVNPQIAQKRWGCMRLAARIQDIEESIGRDLKTRLVVKPNGVKYSEYWL